MRNSSSLDWLRFMHTPNDYRVSRFFIFMVGGLRIKIRVTTVSHKTDSPLCPPLDLHCEK